jgi:D-glycero-alpha-D-manno-heptose 1-phosphate guanylyltransferase
MIMAILSGGLGTRLRSEVSSVPKVMAPINKKPFLEYLIEYFINQKVSSIILSVGYKKESILNHFHSEYKNTPIIYNEEKKALGTGGAIVSLLKQEILYNEKSLFIINGDTFIDISLQNLKDFHQLNDMDITIALIPMKDFDRYGSVSIDGNKVNSFKEKCYVTSGLINAGVYLINKDIFQNFKLPEVFSFEEFLATNVQELKIGAFVVHDTYFIDIGIPSDYKQAQIDFKEIF